ncbi:hypothetical protein [Ralstonia pseudosolanacearum]|uniref:hypothetical protein n=1 Tax=Ralstonia pseudosolanacearum TaxID=1310165 RepID=UPI001402FC20|nr:hypothetical protein [Ralstonia pseudosolanacearum]UNJ30242.1 hypothetical protein MNY32_02685 [Ralstonia pseudosolanacearum]
MKYTPSPAFDRTADELDLHGESFWFNHAPEKSASLLEERIKLTAKLLAKMTGSTHSAALNVLAQAFRFPAWHHLSRHISQATEFDGASLPSGWLDALSAAIVLKARPEDDVALSPDRRAALEKLAGTLSMLSDFPVQKVLDEVIARLCGGADWREVCERHPLKAKAPLYGFTVLDDADATCLSGSFSESPACSELIRELDDQWQGYDEFTAAQKRRARQWVTGALTAQPGFLEGGLALASMEREDGPEIALQTAARYVRKANALIPKGFEGSLPWCHVSNRFYHRLLWLQLELNHELSDSATAARIARKMLRLNPNDNFGVRYVLPYVLLDQENVTGARRALNPIAGEEGLTAAATRAFVAFAGGRRDEFRRELAMALFTLPALRCFLLNDWEALPLDELGYRSIQPDMETFGQFAWSTYCAWPGLREACEQFLAEPMVLKAEQELLTYWNRYWPAERGSHEGRAGSWDGWHVQVIQWVERIAKKRGA